MILTVSTVKTSEVNLRRFVEDNLANGVDHMVIFLDGDDPACARFLESHPHVTAVASREWWNGERPAHLNTRQNINANAVNAVLSRCPWAEWLFHIDSDEVVRLDRQELDGLDPGVRVLRLPTLEAVSHRRGPLRPDLFKRMLTVEELQLLTLLNVIEEPDNQTYFRGHTKGKAGIRPSLDFRAGIHVPRMRNGEPIVSSKAKRSRLLHLDCTNAAEFRRKWEALATSGPPPKLRDSRNALLLAVRAIAGADVSTRTRQRLLDQLYVNTTEDDVKALSRLGFLKTVHVGAGSHVPRQVSPSDLAMFTDALGNLAARPDKVLVVGGRQRDVMAALDGT